MENYYDLQIPAPKLKLPYPPVEISEINGNYGRMMLDNFGGRDSEMSAVATYLYANLILLRDYPEVADVFLQIDGVEMHHLHIFGRLAELEGQDPRLWANVNRRLNYWSPSFITYRRTLAEVVPLSIREEQLAIEKYQKQLLTVTDPYITALLERIILDEEHHIFLFRTIEEIYLK